FSFIPDDKRPLWVVIGNLQPFTSTDDIITSLSELGHQVTHVHNIKRSSYKSPLHLFFIDLKKPPTLISTKSSMYCIPTIGGELHINSIDVYLKGTLRVTATTYHDASDVSIVSNVFTMPLESPVRCALCQGSHSANYKDSSVHKKLNYTPPRLEISFLLQKLI
ncbi:Uncharacterized protein FWK35_00037272, partial [Aphis craccivora]